MASKEKSQGGLLAKTAKNPNASNITPTPKNSPQKKVLGKGVSVGK